MFIKYAAVQLQQLGLKKQLEPVKEPVKEKAETAEKEKESEMEEDEAKRIVESMTEGITCGEKKEVMVCNVPPQWRLPWRLACINSAVHVNLTNVPPRSRTAPSR